MIAAFLPSLRTHATKNARKYEKKENYKRSIFMKL